MYKITRLFSYFVRQFFIPNPFSNIFSDTTTAEIINWIFGGILIPLAYILTGTWYDGNIKTIGSIGFFVNYLILAESFLLITKFISNLFISIVLFMVIYVLLWVLEEKIFGKKISI